VSAVIVSLRVGADAEAAFDVFTQEIGRWWRPSALFALTPRGDGVLSFEGRERLIATLANGHVFEIGRVTAWVRGEQLAFTWRQATFPLGQETSVEVRFETLGAETRVTVAHRGWDQIPREHVARHGFPLRATQMRLSEHWRAVLASFGRRAAT
jgi:hypothetical protein